MFAPGFDDNPALADLTVNLARLMFPIVLLLALSGLVVGMLNSFEHFAVPALAPVAWNLVIIAALVGLVPVHAGGRRDLRLRDRRSWSGTVVQFLLPLPWLRGRGGRLTFTIDWRDERVRRVLKLMLPVTIALGLINLSLLINSIFGTLVSTQAPAAIDKAFRIYQLPQGLFSVAIATILFPTMSRFAARGARDDLRRTMGNGVRQICLLLIPSAVLMAVLAEPITRLVYQRGAFGAEATDLTSDGDGVVVDLAAVPGREPAVLAHLLQPPAPVGHHRARRAQPGRERRVAAALYGPFGIAGIVLGTVVGHDRDVRGAGLDPARRAGRHRGRAGSLSRAVRMLAAAALLGAVSLLHLVRASTRLLGPLAGRPGGVRARRRSPPARSSTPAPSGCCGCRRRGRSRGCS